jgi:hypothetical protein
MPLRSSDRPTLPPSFDVEEFARDSDRRIRSAVSRTPATTEPDDAAFAVESAAKTSEIRIATRPQWRAAVMTHEAWARSLVGTPVVTMDVESLRRLPLDHRAGFVMSLMDGSIDLETILELCGMERDEALALVRDLHDSGVIVFR